MKYLILDYLEVTAARLPHKTAFADEGSAVTFEELFENVRHTELSPYFKRDSFIHVTGKSAKSTLFSVYD